ncbi:oxidoreductase [Penicillium canescens]|uniref:oxidoreductase n=1 Tax=Penicillium canescens TaxID=5083 RepID=UPI0026E034CC|nr:oxidoreductase [Penicillium canescens]KAJ6061512.1 oxidoreductase [Penicillium canescens]
MLHVDELEKHIRELEEQRGGNGNGGIISINQVEPHPWLCRKDIVEWCVRAASSCKRTALLCAAAASRNPRSRIWQTSTTRPRPRYSFAGV